MMGESDGNTGSLLTTQPNQANVPGDATAAALMAPPFLRCLLLPCSVMRVGYVSECVGLHRSHRPAVPPHNTHVNRRHRSTNPISSQRWRRQAARSIDRSIEAATCKQRASHFRLSSALGFALRLPRCRRRRKVMRARAPRPLPLLVFDDSIRAAAAGVATPAAAPSDLARIVLIDQQSVRGVETVRWPRLFGPLACWHPIAQLAKFGSSSFFGRRRRALCPPRHSHAPPPPPPPNATQHRHTRTQPSWRCWECSSKQGPD